MNNIQSILTLLYGCVGGMYVWRNIRFVPCWDLNKRILFKFSCVVWNMTISILIYIACNDFRDGLFLKPLIHGKNKPPDHPSDPVLVAQLCPTLRDPWTACRQAPLSTGFFQTRIWEWFAISFSRGSSWSRDWTQVSHTAGRFFTNWTTREAPYQWPQVTLKWVRHSEYLVNATVGNMYTKAMH